MQIQTPLIPTQIVQAGAGAGKTTELISTVLDFASSFFARHQRYPKVVICTFTRKATQEIKERLYTRALQDKPELIDFVQSSYYLHVSTIHGVCHLFLKNNSSVLRIPPDFSFISFREEEKNIKKILKQELKKDENIAYQQMLSELIESIGYKSTILTLQQLLQESWIEEGPVFVGLSEIAEANQNALAQIADQLQDVAGRIQSETSHEKWQQLAQQFNLQSTAFKKWLKETPSLKANKASDPMDEIIGFNKQISGLLTNAVETFVTVQNRKTVSDETNELKKSVIESMKELNDYPLTESFAIHYEGLRTRLESLCAFLVPGYQKLKIEKAWLTIHDLETLTLYLMKNHPDETKTFSESKDFWMIDEYQDTSPRQDYILERMIGTSPSYIVGDPQQSIYLFRGALSNLFFERQKQIAAKKGVTRSKLINYRSDPTLLKFMNTLFVDLDPQFQAMTPKDESLLKTKKIDAHVVISDDVETEKDLVVKQILLRVKKDHDGAVAIPWQDYCILTRTNQEIDEWAETLEKYAIPFKKHNAPLFFASLEIQDAICLLKFLINPHDNFTVIQLLRTPYIKVSETEIVQALTTKVPASYWSALSEKSVHPVILKLKALLVECRGNSLSDTWVQTLVDVNYFGYLANRDSSGQLEANAWKLIHQIKQSERRKGFDYLQYIYSLEEQVIDPDGVSDSEARPSENQQKLNIMTIHASKGLQFANVIIGGFAKKMSLTEKSPFLEKQDGIHRRLTFLLNDPENQELVKHSLSDQWIQEVHEKEKAEQKRWLYVAATRAEKTLTLCFSPSRFKSSWLQWWPDLQKALEAWTASPDYRVDVQMQSDILESFKELESQSAWTTAVTENAEILKPLVRHGIAHSSTQSVTEILNNKTFAATKNFYMENSRKLPAALWGTYVHRWFESYQFVEHEKFMSQLPSTLKPMFDWAFQEQGGLLKSLIRSGHVEWGFALREEAETKGDFNLIQGQIDLWALDGADDLWIIDYKTGSSGYVEKAFAQMQIYARAVRAIKKVNPKRTHLWAIFLEEKKSIIEQIQN